MVNTFQWSLAFANSSETFSFIFLCIWLFSTNTTRVRWQCWFDSAVSIDPFLLLSRLICRSKLRLRDIWKFHWDTADNTLQILGSPATCYTEMYIVLEPAFPTSHLPFILCEVWFCKHLHHSRKVLRHYILTALSNAPSPRDSYQPPFQLDPFSKQETLNEACVITDTKYEVYWLPRGSTWKAVSGNTSEASVWWARQRDGAL